MYYMLISAAPTVDFPKSDTKTNSKSSIQLAVLFSISMFYKTSNTEFPSYPHYP